MKRFIIILLLLASQYVFSQDASMPFKVYGISPTEDYPSMSYPYYDVESNSYRVYMISSDGNYYTIAYLSENEMNFAIYNNGVLVFPIIIDDEYGNIKIDRRRGSFVFPFPDRRAPLPQGNP
jgi:hypothetical protein